MPASGVLLKCFRNKVRIYKDIMQPAELHFNGQACTLTYIFDIYFELHVIALVVELNLAHQFYPAFNWAMILTFLGKKGILNDLCAELLNRHSCLNGPIFWFCPHLFYLSMDVLE